MINTKLLRNLSLEDKRKMEEGFKYFSDLMGKIAEILKEESKALDKEQAMPPKNVEQWALQQAYMRGQQATYYRVINLLENKE